MTNTVLISIFCADRVGLVSSVSGLLFDLGVNLGDTTFAVLGTGAELTTVAELPGEVSPQEVEQELRQLDELKNAQILVSNFEFSPEHGSSANITHRIKITGGNRPGLITRICEVFIQFKANIVRLNAVLETNMEGDQYIIRIGVWIPEASVHSCLNTITNTTGGMGMKCICQDVRKSNK